MSPDPSRARWLTHTALYLALAVVLPVGFHAFGIGGRVFLPMHIPVLLAGFLMGPASGLTVGLLSPIVSYLLTSMPPSYAVLLMAMEQSIYGLVAGLAYYRLHMNIYVALLTAMVVGRIMFGLGILLLGLFMELPYDVLYFFSSAGPIVTGLPGIALQLVVVPILVAGIQRRRY